MKELSRRRKADNAAKRQEAIQEIYRRRRRADREAANTIRGKNTTKSYKKSKTKQPGHGEVQKVQTELSDRKACGGSEFIVMDPHELPGDKSDFTKVELRTAAEQELMRLSHEDCPVYIDKLTAALKHARLVPTCVTVNGGLDDTFYFYLSRAIILISVDGDIRN